MTRRFFVSQHAPTSDESSVQLIGAPPGAERIGGHAGHDGQPGVAPSHFTTFSAYKPPTVSEEDAPPKRKAAAKKKAT